jgi:hypothetical protein
MGFVRLVSNPAFSRDALSVRDALTLLATAVAPKRLATAEAAPTWATRRNLLYGIDKVVTISVSPIASTPSAMA